MAVWWYGEDLLEVVAKMESYRFYYHLAKEENTSVDDVMANKEFAKNVGKEFRENKIDTIKVRYKLADAKKKKAISSQNSVRGVFPVRKYFSVKREGVYIKDELVLPTEDIKLLSKSETKLQKLGSLIKNYMKEIRASPK